jgi:hypothetical protein
MLFPKLNHTHNILIGLACLMVHTARADEVGIASPTNQNATLRTTIKSEEVPNSTNAKPIQRAYFSIGTNRFAFVIPGDFKLDASLPGKIVLISPDYTGFIAVQVISPSVNEAGGVVIESFRNLASDDFPSGNIVGEFSLRVANHSGPAFELALRNSEGAQQLARVGFVPSPVGFLKFSLLSSSEKYSENQMNFRCFLRSFQSNEGGKLEIPPVSGAS